MGRSNFTLFTMVACLAAAVAGCGGGSAGPGKPGFSAAGETQQATRPTERVSPAPEVNPEAVVWRTPEPPKDPEAGDVWVNPKAGAEMVYVAEGGVTLGTSDAQIDAWLREHPGDMRSWFEDEQPQCRVNLAGYWIGRTEVTNAQYWRFVRATRHRAPHWWERGQIPAGMYSFPVVEVDWQEARAYCQWAGGRLPTELEWEKAARGADGRIFPWGNQWEPKRCRSFLTIMGRTYETDDGWLSQFSLWIACRDAYREGPVVVGSYPADASPYGCFDMAGNVREWCEDWYDEDAYARYARADVAPPASRTVTLTRDDPCRMVRGGDWGGGAPRCFRCAGRDFEAPHLGDQVCGFRYALDAVE